MRQAGPERTHPRRTLAIWRVLLWLAAIWAVAEVPLGTGLQSAPGGSRFALTTADVGDERIGAAVAIAGAESRDGDSPPGSLPSADTGDEPGLDRFGDDRGATVKMPVLAHYPRDHSLGAAPESPLARGPPAFG